MKKRRRGIQRAPLWYFPEPVSLSREEHCCYFADLSHCFLTQPLDSVVVVTIRCSDMSGSDGHDRVLSLLQDGNGGRRIGGWPALRACCWRLVLCLSEVLRGHFKFQQASLVLFRLLAQIHIWHSKVSLSVCLSVYYLHFSKTINHPWAGLLPWTQGRAVSNLVQFGHVQYHYILNKQHQ